MYAQAGAVLRQDLNAVVMEAASADSLFIGDQVYPAFEQDAKNGQYPKIRLGTGRLLKRATSTRSTTGSYNEIIRAWETDTYDCVDRGLKERVDDSQARNIGRFFDAESMAAKLTYRNMRIDLEMRRASALFDVTTATGFRATAASVAYTEANLATIAFHKDVLDAVDRLNGNGQIPNTVVLSANLFNRVRRSTLAQNFIRGAGKATDAALLLNPSDLAGSLNGVGIQTVLVGALQYDQANEGLKPSITPVWGNTYLWVGNIESGSPTAGGAGRTFVWNKDGGLLVTETYRDEDRRSDMVRVRTNDIVKNIDQTAGELVTTSWA